MTEPSDDQVIERVRAGDTAAFEVLMRRHNQRIFRACRAILADDAEAEDVMQEAYVRAFTNLGSFAGRAAFSTWLTRIAVHEAYARIRRRRRFAPMDPYAALENDNSTRPQPPDPERVAYQRQLARVLELAIDDLPETYRTVFMLRAIEGMSGAEVAACLGIPEETVKTRLFRARGLLQSGIEARTESALPAVHRFLHERCDRVVDAVLRRIGARS